MVVPGGTQVAQGRGGVEAGKGRGGQTLTARIDPQRGGAGQDADPVAAPDRVPVADPLGVVPHAVRWIQCAPAAAASCMPAPSTLAGTPCTKLSGMVPSPA